MALYWSFLLPSFVCLAFTCFNQCFLKSGLLQKISSAEEEFNNMPIEKAGRLFVQLAKAEADRKRTDYATKRKAELAFDQMEADLLAQVRQYPDLAAQLRDVLNQARTRIANADLE